jgi:cyclopropane fatty-acyl-phospholipid synthase-like methyltransferase
VLLVAFAAMTPYEDAPGQLARVRQFYDRNTARFQRLGRGGASFHRAVWGPGRTTREQAIHHVDEVVLSLLVDDERPRVVDLGCGIGGSLIHLASRRLDLVGEGVTISPAQVDVAATLVARAGLSERVRVREGDFLSPQTDLAGADLAFSIEAFVHAPDPAAYFRAAAGLLRPGGLLVVCDDVLTAAGTSAPPPQARRLDEFRTGWRVGALLTVDEVTRYAALAGFSAVGDDDLTPYLELRRPRDRWIGLLVAVTRPLRLRGEYWWSLAGGAALQYCLATGLVSYRLLVFKRGTEQWGEEE